MLVSIQVILLFKVWLFKVVTILGVTQILAEKKQRKRRHQMKAPSPPAMAPLLLSGNLLMQFF